MSWSMDYKIATVKWNGGNGALLCNRCRTILAYGFQHEDKEHFCVPKCREIEPSDK